MPGSVEAWPASQTTSKRASGQAVFSFQAASIGVTTSKRPCTIQPGMPRIFSISPSNQPSFSKKPRLAKKWHSIRAKAMAKSISLNLAGLASGPRIEMVSPSHWLQAAAGVTITFALYVLINGAMVMGLAPVVGVPMPLLSSGGTVMLTVMVGFGLVLSVGVHRYSEVTSGRGQLI